MLPYNACYYFARSEAMRRSRGGRPPTEPPMLPCNACYYFVRSEAVADSGAYNTIKGVGGSLRPPPTCLMQALPLQNFSPDSFPGLVLVLAPALGLVYSISAPNKSEAPTLPGLTQTGEDSASDWSGVGFLTFNLHVTGWCQTCLQVGRVRV